MYYSDDKLMLHNVLLLAKSNVDPNFHSLHTISSRPIIYPTDVNCFLSRNIHVGAIKWRVRL